MHPRQWVKSSLWQGGHQLLLLLGCVKVNHNPAKQQSVSLRHKNIPKYYNIQIDIMLLQCFQKLAYQQVAKLISISGKTYQYQFQILHEQITIHTGIELLQIK